MGKDHCFFLKTFTNKEFVQRNMCVNYIHILLRLHSPLPSRMVFRKFFTILPVIQSTISLKKQLFIDLTYNLATFSGCIFLFN